MSDQVLGAEDSKAEASGSGVAERATTGLGEVPLSDAQVQQAVMLLPLPEFRKLCISVCHLCKGDVKDMVSLMETATASTRSMRYFYR